MYTKKTRKIVRSYNRQQNESKTTSVTAKTFVQHLLVTTAKSLLSKLIVL